MGPSDCPKFSKCNAPICPLDQDWDKRTHSHGEPICLWLREWSKPTGKATLGHAVGEQMARRIGETAPLISARHSDIRDSLRQAAKYGSKVANGMRLKKSS